MKINRLRPNTGFFRHLFLIFQYIAMARPQGCRPIKSKAPGPGSSLCAGQSRLFLNAGVSCAALFSLSVIHRDFFQIHLIEQRGTLLPQLLLSDTFGGGVDQIAQS